MNRLIFLHIPSGLKLITQDNLINYASPFNGDICLYICGCLGGPCKNCLAYGKYYIKHKEEYIKII